MLTWYVPDRNLYGILISLNNGYWFNNTSGELEEYDLYNWDDYVIEVDGYGLSSIYIAEIPSNLPDGIYGFSWFEYSEYGPDESDECITIDKFQWINSTIPVEWTDTQRNNIINNVSDTKNAAVSANNKVQNLHDFDPDAQTVTTDESSRNASKADISGLAVPGSEMNLTEQSKNVIINDVLIKNWEQITGTVPDNCMLQALRALLNKWELIEDKYRVYKEDNTTVAWQKELTFDPETGKPTGMK